MLHDVATAPELTCTRCGHTWQPRKPIVVACPKCRSPYFDKPRRVAKAQAPK